MLKVLSTGSSEALSLPLRLAVIDLGANSAHLLIVHIWEDLTYTPVYRDRAQIRMGSPVFGQGEIDPKTLANARTVLKKFLHKCEHHEVDVIRTVATSAIREASNGQEFVQSIHEDFGLEIHVLPGREEARLTALAATESLGLKQGKVFVMDVGGGTTEAAWLEDNQTRKLWSFRIGTVRILSEVRLEDPPGEAGLQALRLRARQILAPMFQPRFKHPDWALATSGTAVCLGQLCGTKRRAVTGVETFVVVEPALVNLLRRLSELPLEKRREWLGGFSDRADTILGGGMVFLTAMQEMGFETFVTGGKALREGIILNFIHKEILSTAKDRSHRLVESARKGTVLDDPVSLRERNILKLARSYHYDADHCFKTLQWANEIFDGLHSLHLLGDEDRFYLQAAALLHDIGYHISPTHHNLHSQYLVVHSELEGFHQMELRVIGNLVRYHSSEMPSRDHPDYAALPPPLQKKVDILAGILRIADALDFTHSGNVEGIKVETSQETITIRIRSKEAVDLEAHEVRVRGELLECALDRRLEVVVDPPEEQKLKTPA